jgi:hypothetical protein
MARVDGPRRTRQHAQQVDEPLKSSARVRVCGDAGRDGETASSMSVDELRESVVVARRDFEAVESSMLLLRFRRGVETAYHNVPDTVAGFSSTHECRAEAARSGGRWDCSSSGRRQLRRRIVDVGSRRRAHQKPTPCGRNATRRARAEARRPIRRHARSTASRASGERPGRSQPSRERPQSAATTVPPRPFDRRGQMSQAHAKLPVPPRSQAAMAAHDGEKVSRS